MGTLKFTFQCVSQIRMSLSFAMSHNGHDSKSTQFKLGVRSDILTENEPRDIEGWGGGGHFVNGNDSVYVKF